MKFTGMLNTSKLGYKTIEWNNDCVKTSNISEGGIVYECVIWDYY